MHFTAATTFVNGDYPPPKVLATGLGSERRLRAELIEFGGEMCQLLPKVIGLTSEANRLLN
jgi:hypothetical protein